MPEEKQVLDETSFRANSHKSKSPPSPQGKKIVKVVNGPVKTKKKSLGRRFSETFIGEDKETVKSYLLFDVIVPAVKDTISELVKSAIDMILFGDTKASNVRRRGGASYTSYGSYYNNRSDRGGVRRGGPGATRTNERDRREGRYNNRASHDFRDIIFPYRQDAEQVLSALVELTIQYDMATVAELNELCGLDSNYCDEGYGWEELGSARVMRVRDGYILDMPTPGPVD